MRPQHSLDLWGFQWQTQKTVELSFWRTAIGVLLRRASAAMARRVSLQSDIAEKSSVCKYIPYLSHIYLLRAKINHGYL